MEGVIATKRTCVCVTQNFSQGDEKCNPPLVNVTHMVENSCLVGTLECDLSFQCMLHVETLLFECSLVRLPATLRALNLFLGTIVFTWCCPLLTPKCTRYTLLSCCFSYCPYLNIFVPYLSVNVITHLLPTTSLLLCCLFDYPRLLFKFRLLLLLLA